MPRRWARAGAVSCGSSRKLNYAGTERAGGYVREICLPIPVATGDIRPTPSGSCAIRVEALAARQRGLPLGSRPR